MKKIQSFLLEKAKNECLPYLKGLPQFSSFENKLSFLIVGSVASGLCRKNSDIDIAVVSREKIFDEISKNTSWKEGKPSEVMIGEAQLHYYGITLEKIEQKLVELNDFYLYEYSNAIVLEDPSKNFTKKISVLTAVNPMVRKQRLEGKLDMLIRRNRAIKYSLELRDIMSVGKIVFEVMSLALKVIALLDDVSFDPRKRLFNTALKGKIGKSAEDEVRHLFGLIGQIGNLRTDSEFSKFSFPKEMNIFIGLLSHEAAAQGFQVGLEKPDMRFAER
ncbi:nucleotidyltransferase domain-containing protein [candidate division WOR-3 bacterium]|nr:nucleotidyltransferase domain-containing protein [candidate division WOR-3 bacterium]